MSYQRPTSEQITNALSLVNWLYVLETLNKDPSDLALWAQPEGEDKLHIYLPASDNGQSLTLTLLGSGLNVSNTVPILSGTVNLLEFWSYTGEYDFLFSIVPPSSIKAESIFPSFIDNFKPDTDSFDIASLSKALGLTNATDIPGYKIKTSANIVKEGQFLTIQVIPEKGAKALKKAYLVFKGMEGSNVTHKDFANAGEIGLSEEALAMRIKLDGKNPYDVKLAISKETPHIESDYEEVVVGLFSSIRFNQDNWDSQADPFQIAQPAKFIIENVLHSPSTIIKPVLIHDHTFSFAEARTRQPVTNFITAELGNKEIKNFTVRDWNVQTESGYFILEGKRLSEAGVISSHSLTSSQLQKLAWVPGERGISDQITISIHDIHGNVVTGEPGEWKTTELQPLVINDNIFSHDKVGVPQKLTDLIAGNFASDSIVNFKVTDWNPNVNSGFFSLNGLRLGKTNESITHTLSTQQFKDLDWSPGTAGSQDPITVDIVDSSGNSEISNYDIWSTGYGPTEYKWKTKSGYAHVSEGQSFEVIIEKHSNHHAGTQIQYQITDLKTETPDSINDFADISPGDWKALVFEPTQGEISTTQSASIILNTLKDSTSEGSEWVRLWLYNQDIDNNQPRASNPAYSYLDFQIHDKIYYAMSPSISIAEGESQALSVARFGGGNKPSTATLKVQSLSEAIPGFKRTSGVALSGSDYKKVLPETKTFSKDYDWNNSINADGFLQAELNPTRDANPEPVEMLSWALFDKKSKLIANTTRIANITDAAPKYTLQSLDAGAVQAFFNTIGNWFLDILKIKSTTTSTGAAFQKSLKKNKSSQHPNNPSIRVTPLPNAGLIGVDGGSLIGPDGGSLIGVDGGSLIGVDGGSLIGVDGGSLIGVDGGSLIGVDGGSLIGVDGGSLSLITGGNLNPSTMPSTLQAARFLASNHTSLGNQLIAAGGLN